MLCSVHAGWSDTWCSHYFCSLGIASGSQALENSQGKTLQIPLIYGQSYPPCPSAVDKGASLILKAKRWRKR